MKKSKFSSLRGISDLPEQLDLQQLFEVKGGGDVNACVGKEVEGVTCPKDGSATTCTSAAVINCTVPNSGVLICTSNANGGQVPPPKDDCAGKKTASLIAPE